MAQSSQYSGCASVPLIKSPSLYLPPPTTLPPTIHPLPDSITPYFVYPFTLEPHVLQLEEGRRTRKEERKEEWKRIEEERKMRRQREVWRFAPGLDLEGRVLEPTKAKKEQAMKEGSPSQKGDAMDDLVERLAAMEK